MDYNKIPKEELESICEVQSKKIDYLEKQIEYLKSIKNRDETQSLSFMFTNEEVKDLLQTQRINCRVAVMKHLPDDVLNKISMAPEPGGDQWRK